MTRRLAREAGQASVELLAVLPALVVCVAIAASALPAGWALWSAANAARAGARAEHVGDDGEAAARRALPGALRKGAEVGGEANVTRVRVSVPFLIPGADPARMRAASRLDPGGG
jgi:pilus assembly protein CpaE